MTKLSDEALIDAILGGSESAFEQLVGRHQDRLFGLLRRLVKDQFAVEDLAQEVFVKVFQKLHTFNRDSAFFTWVYRIAVNAATDYLERQGRRKLRLVEDISVLDFSARDTRREREADLGGAAAPLMEEELRRVTREILADLPEKYRTILVLREYEELSYTDIAEVLGCSMGTVESRLFRARKRFKDAIERQHPDLAPANRGGRS